jgi:DNA topoisomerase-1
MSKNLVVVESPAKAKTITKYLTQKGQQFSVLASYGHVRDLIPKKGAVEPDNDFLMHYEVSDKHTHHIKKIVEAIKKAEVLYLATDPDREGEAIAWHVYQILQDQGALKNKTIHRIAFHQITKAAVREALEQPRQLDMNLINAQQTRRALDYLVGFNLSPLLWRKIQKGLSAGRVQSPALCLIVEREHEIEKFKSQEYWSVHSMSRYEGQDIDAKLIQFAGQKLTQFSIENEKQATEIKQTLLKKSEGKLIVHRVEKKTRKRQPAPPFITSTLQQEAVHKLGFTTKKTMQIAQKLYEGIELDSETVGLITYMRTDSVHLAKEAVDEMRGVVTEKYGTDFLPDNPRFFKSKVKNAQEAHEAIRPTSFHRQPADLKSYLSTDQYRLYELIWKRALASQMKHATLHLVSIDCFCGDEKDIFRATGSVISDPGFMVLYQAEPDDKSKMEEKSVLLPPVKKGDVLDLKEIKGVQHFTEPPPRYSEATLIKTLEAYGIGRPSTYATIVSTLLQRDYVSLQKKQFHPTDMGRVVAKFLTEYFTRYVDYNFTAKLEDELDAIARGEKTWLPILRKFWKSFEKQIDEVSEKASRKAIRTETLDEVCPQCGKPLLKRLSRTGYFIGCSGYPDCRYTRSFDGDTEDAGSKESWVIEGRTCPKCGSALQYKFGRFGKFIGCTAYPTCRYIESLNKPIDTGVKCPECNKGNLLARRSKRGKLFYGCSAYPDCKYALWNKPINEMCPRCKYPIMMIKITKRRGTEKVCPKEGCGYTEAVPTEETETTA